MNADFNEAYKVVEQNRQDQLQAIRNLKTKAPSFLGPINLDDGSSDSLENWGNIPRDKISGPKSDDIGCYIVKHITARTPAVVGRGGISGRLSTLRCVFRNEGKAILSKSGNSQTTYPATRGMYKDDPELKNWEYMFIVTGKNNKDDPISTENAEELSRQLERILIAKYSPKYSDPKMAGK